VQLYNETPGWTQRGPGSTCVTLNGHIHYYMKIANISDPSCGLDWFIFDDIFTCCNCISPKRKQDTGLKKVNSYSVDLHFFWVLRLGPDQMGSTLSLEYPRMVDQRQHFDICSVVNDRQTENMMTQVQTHNSFFRNVSMDSEEAEPITFPVLFPYALWRGWIY
jgi:hypothetical protein